MDNFKEQPKFKTREVIEQRPFKSPAVQSFFAKWCEANDSIRPEIIGRGEWEKRGEKGLLEKRPDGKQTLYIPEDLQLWEMVGVIEAVDHDTFADKPERKDEAKKKLLELGKTFQNSGVYIAQRLDSIREGKEIAGALAEEFYHYGSSLAKGTKEEPDGDINDIASHPLTDRETETVDRFLAGDNLYKSRRARAEKEEKLSGQRDEGGKLLEADRRKTLAQFFRTSSRAFELKKRSEEGELDKNNDHSKPWENDAPFHSAFITKIDKAISQKIETPKRELSDAIFRRGMELLQKNMPFDKLPAWVKGSVLHWKNGETTLREALQIDKLRSELEDTRRLGDKAKISTKERQIADKIQVAVSNFQYQNTANNPSEMVANQEINCVGASMLGGSLIREAGLNYLVGQVPEHSILFLVTNDGHVEWRDMLSPSQNEDITNEMTKNINEGEPAVTIDDIVAFSKKPTSEGLMFDITKKMPWIKKESQRPFVALFEPEYGQKIQILNNAGSALINLGRKEEAIEAYRQAIAIDPKFAYPYHGLGTALSSLGRKEGAIEAYRQAIAVDPKFSYPYNDLGGVLLNIGRNEEAIEAYRQAIAIDPKFSYSYYGLGSALFNLGRKEEAIETYQKFIALADKQKDGSWIKRAEAQIEKLAKK